MIELGILNHDLCVEFKFRGSTREASRSWATFPLCLEVRRSSCALSLLLLQSALNAVAREIQHQRFILLLHSSHPHISARSLLLVARPTPLPTPHPNPPTQPSQAIIMYPIPRMPATLGPRAYHEMAYPGAFSRIPSPRTARSVSVSASASARRSPARSRAGSPHGHSSRSLRYADSGFSAHSRRRTASTAHPDSLRSHTSSS